MELVSRRRIGDPDGDDGDGSDDGEDSSDSDSSGDDGDGEQGSNTVDQEQEEDPTRERWKRVLITRGTGGGFFHRELMKVLERAYGIGRAASRGTQAAGRSSAESELQTESYRVPGSCPRSATLRMALPAALQDAARQAFLVYNDKHYDLLEHRSERYYPRRIPGEAGCIIASTLHQRSSTMDATVNLNAVVHTELDHAVDEIRMLEEENARLRSICDNKRAELGGPVTLDGYFDTIMARERPRLSYGLPYAKLSHSVLLANVDAGANLCQEKSPWRLPQASRPLLCLPIGMGTTMESAATSVPQMERVRKKIHHTTVLHRAEVLPVTGIYNSRSKLNSQGGAPKLVAKIGDTSGGST
ncbi:hypothetical protein U9M48_042334 [Paspalum notatum var. saurae]|uniref:Uncharacterized protein n=1 Tax=Paspalum notatum var. saurae TaxID=547442 RepID=A0AAQ3XF38_PASNO